MGDICGTWSCGNVEEQMRKHLLSHTLSPVPSRLYPSAPPSPVFSRRGAVFAVSSPVNPISSPPLSSSSPFFLLCPSHPLVLTPGLIPLKSPGNKLWCLRSSLLSRSPHPSSQSADTSAVKAGPVQKARPLHSVLYKHVGLERSNVSPLFSLFLLFSLFFAARVLCVQCAMLTVAALCQKKHTQTHTCMHTHTQSRTHSWAPAAYKDWGLEINEGERRKGERSLNKLALEKRRKMRKREWGKQGERKLSLKKAHQLNNRGSLVHGLTKQKAQGNRTKYVCECVHETQSYIWFNSECLNESDQLCVSFWQRSLLSLREGESPHITLPGHFKQVTVFLKWVLQIWIKRLLHHIYFNAFLNAFQCMKNYHGIFFVERK